MITPFYGNAMKRDRLFHILRFLHFTDNRNEPDMREIENFKSIFLFRQEDFIYFSENR